MYSTNNEGKPVIAERFIRTLKNNIHKHITSISKNVYIDKLDDIADECNNTYHVNSNDKDHEFKFGDHVQKYFC